MLEKSSSFRDRILDILFKKKLLTEEDVKRAKDAQKKQGGKIDDILVGMGLVSRNDLTSIMSQELGFPPMDLSRYKINPEVIKFIPKKTARQYKIIPVSKIGDVLTVAMADPLNIFAIDDLKTLTGLKIGPVIASTKDVEDAIAEHYGEAAYATIEKIMQGMDAERETILTAAEEASSAELLRLTQEAPIIQITDLLLSEGVKKRASDILIEPLENELRVRYRVDGVLQEGRRPPKQLHPAVVSRFKVMSDLDIAEHRLPQDGRFKIRIQQREVDFRISVLPSSKGEKVALRILDKSQAMLDVEKLGFGDKALQSLKKYSQKPHGMILVCGPTGCGKTTTLYSVLTFIDSPETNIVTVEDPVEYQLWGINQVTFRPEIGLTFASALRSILRQDPDIIMVGEIRDAETIDIAIKAALTGHLVLSTLHTNTSTGSVIRLINMGAEPFLIASSVLLVAAQRLVREICPKCKEPYEIDEKTGKKYGIKQSGKTTLFRGKGCKECAGQGYKGRTALIEALPITPAIRDLILEKAQEYRLRETARKEGMVTLRQTGIEKVLAGITTLEEVLRVTVGDQDIETR